MKPETAWNELRRAADVKNNKELAAIMDEILAAPEPEYVYRLYYEYSPWSRSHARVGSKHRMRCILNNGYSHGGVKVERTPVRWEDVTKDFHVPVS